ncbi:hypothetical protein CRE_05025 [Caenorhabditis remanei]|uniref:Serpentine receptor class gamma n=1 Tax=Caenorhabditis remanei TaxID=31234 RepID=E3MZ31_CAERE|nr:hypothetical protein CRE_05025 [Caenorhabditis remanei]
MANSFTSNLLFIFLVLLFGSIGTLLVIIFPFYVRVSLANREKDKNAVVYPIIKHFFNAICFFYLSVVLCLTFFAMNALMGIFDNKDFEILLLFPWAIFVHAHHLILFFLSLQKFLIYFFPETENFLITTGKSTDLIAFSLYLILTTTHLIFFLWIMFQSGDDYPNVEIYTGYYIFINSALFSSVLLYIPIVISIGKHAHLYSFVRNKPHKFIVYQTLLIAFFKSPSLWSSWYAYTESYSIIMCLIMCIVFDLISTPVLIQVSYLFCNKRNVNTLSKQLPAMKYIKLVFYTKTSRVNPMTIQTDFQTVGQ